MRPCLVVALICACGKPGPAVGDAGTSVNDAGGAALVDAGLQTTGFDSGLADAGGDGGRLDAGTSCLPPTTRVAFVAQRRTNEVEAFSPAEPTTGTSVTKSLPLRRVLPHSWLTNAEQHVAAGRVGAEATVQFELYDVAAQPSAAVTVQLGSHVQSVPGPSFDENGAPLPPGAPLARCVWHTYSVRVPSTVLRFRIKDDRTVSFATPSGAEQVQLLSNEDGNNQLIVRSAAPLVLGRARLTVAVQAPLVLVHGVNDNQMMWADWLAALRVQGYLADASLDLSAAGAVTAVDRPDERLKEDGRLAHNDSFVNNATKLLTHLEALAVLYGSRDFHLVAHSKGGLDSIAFLQRSFDDNGPTGAALRQRVNVLSLSTLGSPFAGSAAADIQLAIIEGAFHFKARWPTVTAGGSALLPQVCGGTLAVFPWAWQTLDTDPWSLSCSQPATSWSSWGRFFADDDGVDEFLYSAVTAVGQGGSVRGPGLYSLRTARRDNTLYEPSNPLFRFSGWARTSPPMANLNPVDVPGVHTLLDWTNPNGVAFFGYAADADFRRGGSSDCRQGTGSGLYGCIDSDEEADFWGPGPSRLTGWDTPWSYWVASQTWASTYMYRFMGRVGGVDVSSQLVRALGYDYVRLERRSFDTHAIVGADPCALVTVGATAWQPNDLVVTCDSARHPLQRVASARSGFVLFQGEAAHHGAFKRVLQTGAVQPETSTCSAQGANHISMTRAGHLCKLHALLGRIEDTYGLVPFFGNRPYANPQQPDSYVDVRAP